MTDQLGLFGLPPEEPEPAEEPARDAWDRPLEEGEPEPESSDEEGPPEVVPGQSTLFGADEDFHVAWSEWRGMPEFSQQDLTPWKSLLVHFATIEDYRAFAELVAQRLSPRTQSIWYPAAEIGHFTDKRYAAVEAAPEVSTP